MNELIDIIRPASFRGNRCRIIVSGGGTGGHIFPAIAIAKVLVERDPAAKVLFVGAKGRMEMEKVPAAGFRIIGLPVMGFDRRNPVRNFVVLYRLIRSLFIAHTIIRRFRPDVAIGVGGYVSAPLLLAAALRNVPAVIHESNSYAGIANRLLGRMVRKVCVAYEGMERFFPKRKLVVTGNPVRRELEDCRLRHEESLAFFDLKRDKPTILVLGGSLGARTVNRSVEQYLEKFPNDLQLIWQTGKLYYDRAEACLQKRNRVNIRVFPFIRRMDLAYAAADLVISRAGAGTISELSLTGKPCILVPSPNVAEDHQTKNAMTLVERRAALMIRDADAVETLLPTAVETVRNHEVLEPLSDNIKQMAKYRSADAIADVVMNMMKS